MEITYVLFNSLSSVDINFSNSNTPTKVDKTIYKNHVTCNKINEIKWNKWNYLLMPNIFDSGFVKNDKQICM